MVDEREEVVKPIAALALAGGVAALAWFVLGRAPTPAAAPAPAPATPTGPPAPPTRGKRRPPAVERPGRPSDSDPRMIAALAQYEAEKRASSGYFFKSKPMWIWNNGAWVIGYAV